MSNVKSERLSQGLSLQLDTPLSEPFDVKLKLFPIVSSTERSIGSQWEHSSSDELVDIRNGGIDFFLPITVLYFLWNERSVPLVSEDST
mmetsp:Transcript_61560/g.70738  ORF Transcript_61560/g.70738 Transcript_61560/m.70738 type:complete len:89 (-) Transcript_61560:1561-1827(-)